MLIEFNDRRFKRDAESLARRIALMIYANDAGVELKDWRNRHSWHINSGANDYWLHQVAEHEFKLSYRYDIAGRNQALRHMLEYFVRVEVKQLPDKDVEE